MGSKAKVRGRITYSDQFGHVCTCTEKTIYGECEGHPAGPFDPMGETVYCDGKCNPIMAEYENSVRHDFTVAPTESGSYLYYCSNCGATAWSGL